jgi:hypothetical protein
MQPHCVDCTNFLLAADAFGRFIVHAKAMGYEQTPDYKLLKAILLSDDNDNSII